MLPTSPRILSGATKLPTYAIPTDQRKNISRYLLCGVIEMAFILLWPEDHEKMGAGYSPSARGIIRRAATAWNAHGLRGWAAENAGIVLLLIYASMNLAGADVVETEIAQRL